MRYTRKALGLLKKQYISVLKKCAIINIAFITISASAHAYSSLSEAVDDSALTDKTYELTSDENLSGNLNPLNGQSLSIQGNNYTVVGNNNQGLLIANMGVAQNLYITNTNFKSFNNTTSGQGGVITNYMGNINRLSGSFLNNSATTEGGAIYNWEGTINIYAKDLATEFTGNIANGKSNAIKTYGGTINLNAGEKNITFNDGIEGVKFPLSQSDSIININKDKIDISVAQDRPYFAPTNGVVEFNNAIGANELNLYNGTLKFGHNTQNNIDYYGSLVSGTKFNIYGGFIDLSDNNIKNTNLSDIILHNNASIGLDIDLQQKTLDSFTANATTNNYYLELKKLNILNDADQNITEISIDTKNNLIKLNNILDITVGENVRASYLYMVDTVANKIKFGKNKTLETAVHFANAQKSFVMGKDEILSGDLGALTGTELVIGSNGKSVNGNNFKGISLSPTQEMFVTDTSFYGFNGAAIINNGVLTLNAENHNIIFDSAITGNGNILLTGNKNISFNTAVNAAEVVLKNGVLKLKNGDELKSVETFQANGGILDIDTQHITLKQAEFNKGSMLNITVNTDKNGSLYADKLVLNGGTLNVTLAQGLVDISNNQKTISVFSSANPFVDNLSSVYDNNMYHFEKSATAGDYIVSLIRQASDVSRENGGTTNNENTAKAWIDGNKFSESSSQKQLADNLADLAQNNASQLNKALTSLAPNDSPVLQSMMLLKNNQIFDNIENRLHSSSKNRKYGLSSGDNIFNDGSVFVQILGNYSKINDMGKIYGFNIKSSGIMLGAEKKLTDTIKSGIGYAFTTDKINAYERKADVDTNTAFVYGEYKPNNWFAHLATIYNWSDYNEKKFIINNHYTAKYNVKNLAANAITGYDAYIYDFKITPETGLRYNNVRRNSYTDQIGQKVSSDNLNYLTALGGIKLSKNIYNCFEKSVLYWRPEIHLTATYDIVTDKENSFVSLSNGSTYFIEGKNLKQFGLEAGVKTSFNLSDNVESDIGYEGKFRKDFISHTGYVNLKYNF